MVRGSEPRVLFVCTANRIRSPLAAALFRRLAAERAVAVAVDSAGFGPAGLPVLDRAAVVARELGLDLAGHRSRTVDAAAVHDADLVVGMEADHLLRLVDLAPDRAGRVYRVRELARLAEQRPAPTAPTGAAVAAWPAALPHRDLAAALDPGLDVADPVGRPLRAFRRTASELSAALTVVADAWFGPVGNREGGR